MNDQWLQSFLTAAQNGSFSKAAKTLLISTPSLVQQINLMEKGLGFSLFVRSPKGVSLTPAGRAFGSAAPNRQAEKTAFRIQSGRKIQYRPQRTFCHPQPVGRTLYPVPSLGRLGYPGWQHRGCLQA